MDLYHKKVKIGNKNSKRSPDQNDIVNRRQKNTRNIYIQKMIPQNDFSSSSRRISNVRSSMEDILSNEENKNRAINYVIKMGKNRDIYNSPRDDVYRRFEKSASPNNRKRLGNFPNVYANSYETTPRRSKYSNPKGDRYFSNRLTTVNDYAPITYIGSNNLRNKNRINDDITYKNIIYSSRRKYAPYNDYYDNEENNRNSPNYINIEESENDLDYYNNDNDRIPNERNVEPKMSRRVNKVLSETYERAAKRVRNKDIVALPQIRKDSHNKYINSVNTSNDDLEELIRTIEDLQAINKKQKNDLRNMRKDNYNKDKEIDLLKNKLDSVQRKLDDKLLEHEKEIDDIYKNNDNDSKLKNEYFKLLQDYDTNINDYNNLKEDYNKMVDEYNNLKSEKNKLNEDNKNLKQSNMKIKEDYNNIKTEANKTLDDYNNIVDDYDNLERQTRRMNNDLEILQKENDRLKKDYERIRVRNRGKQNEEKKDEEFNKLNDDYDKLNEELNIVNKELNNVKDINEQLRNENNKIKKALDSQTQSPKDENYDRLYNDYNKLKNYAEDLKKENENLKNSNNNIYLDSPNRKTSQESYDIKSPDREDPTKMKENYDKLKNYYKTLANEYNKLKENHKKVTKEYNDLVDNFNKIYSSKLKSDSEKLNEPDNDTNNIKTN